MPGTALGTGNSGAQSIKVPACMENCPSVGERLGTNKHTNEGILVHLREMTEGCDLDCYK